MLNFDENAFKAFIERLPICIACFDDQRRYIAVNDVCVQINGLSREETIGRTIEELMPGLVEPLTPIFDKVYLQNETVSNKLIEGKTPASDQTRFWLASYQPLLLGDGKSGMLVTAEEITQQVFAKEAAETNKRLLSDVLNSLFTFVGLLDSDGVLLDANNAPLAAAGIALDQVQGKYFWDCYWWTYSESAMKKIKDAVNKAKAGEASRFDIDVRVAEGFICVDFMMEALKDEHGAISHIIPSAIDITERKKAEEQLSFSQARFETVINRTVDGLVAFDQSGVIHFVNKRFEELTENNIFIGKSSIYSYINDDDIHSCINELIDFVYKTGIHSAINSTEERFKQTVCVLHPKNVHVEIAFTPLLDGENILYLATISDVSALYSANQALEKALKEKTVLLNEVHHRVKNNLQVMSSLLNLQAFAEGIGQKTREALLDSQRRLKSMALIHELLYECEDFTRANLQIFTHKLIQLLQDSMTDSHQIKVKTEFTQHIIYLPVDQMVPFGFLITELMTNAFKYAFTKEQVSYPQITVKIMQMSDDIEVVIADNGCGFDTDVKQQRKTLGNELVMIFAKQLKAELSTVSDNGVVHTLRF